MPATELTLEEGIQEAIERIDTITERPVLVAVYGWHGKSYFIGLLENHFRKKGWDVGASKCAPRLEEFERLKDRPDSIPNLRIYHCGWDLTDVTELGLCGHEDPNHLAQTIAGRSIHLNVGIYNPFLEGRHRGNSYHILIANTGGREK